MKGNARAKSGYITIALFALAATLLIFSVAGSSRAALTFFSETYGAEVSMYDIGVTLVENGAGVSSRNYTGSSDAWDTSQGVLVGQLREETEGELALGHKYKEELAVTNSGTIDEYVRVTVDKYWEEDGRKRTDLDPSLIDLHLANEGSWYHDAASDTAERIVLYYTGVLPSGGTTVPFSDTLEIQDEGVQASVTKETVSADGSTIKTEYDYDGVRFVLQVDVDAVQTHNAGKAITSAWGVNILGIPDD